MSFLQESNIHRCCNIFKSGDSASLVHLISILVSLSTLKLKKGWAFARRKRAEHHDPSLRSRLPKMFDVELNHFFLFKSLIGYQIVGAGLSIGWANRTTIYATYVARISAKDINICWTFAGRNQVDKRYSFVMSHLTREREHRECFFFFFISNFIDTHVLLRLMCRSRWAWRRRLEFLENTAKAM